MPRFNGLPLIFWILTSVILSHCGNDSSSSSSVDTVPLTGTVSLGPCAGATVNAYLLNADQSQGASIAQTLTDSQGNFTLPIPGDLDPDQTLLVQSSDDGLCFDEQSGAQEKIPGSGLTLVVTAEDVLGNPDALAEAGVTPASEIAASLAVGDDAASSAFHKALRSVVYAFSGLVSPFRSDGNQTKVQLKEKIYASRKAAKGLLGFDPNARPQDPRSTRSISTHPDASAVTCFLGAHATMAHDAGVDLATFAKAVAKSVATTGTMSSHVTVGGKSIHVDLTQAKVTAATATFQSSGRLRNPTVAAAPPPRVTATPQGVIPFAVKVEKKSTGVYVHVDPGSRAFGADSYRLKISTKEDFSKLVIDSTLAGDPTAKTGVIIDTGSLKTNIRYFVEIDVKKGSDTKPQNNNPRRPPSFVL